MSRSGWTEVFSALPDSGFFDVVRNYLGPVSTPFHKPELVARMESFLGRDDVLQKVLDYLDEDDVRILTIVSAAESISGSRLAGMLPDMRYVAFREKLLNLEERLLLWSRSSGRTRQYELTSLGSEAGRMVGLGPGLIIGDGVEHQVSETKSWLDDNFLTCALAYLSERPLVFRKEGGWRKKALENLKEAFPLLFRDGRGEDRLIMAGRGLLSMGLVERRGEKLIPDIDTWRQLENLDPATRLAMVRARAAVGKTIPLEKAVPAIDLLGVHLPEGRYFRPEVLATLFQVASADGLISPRGALRVVSHLELMGILQPDTEGNLGRCRNTSRVDDDPAKLLTITAVGDISLRPGSALSCELALMTRPTGLDVTAGFILDKTRFQNGLEDGVSARKLIDLIEKRSGRPVPGNIVTQCGEWESEYRELHAQAGIVLRAEGLRKEILENTGILDPLALDKPAEGIWILSPANAAEWRAALAGIGIERIPGLRDPSPGSALFAGQGDSESPDGLPWLPAFVDSPLAGGSWNRFVSKDSEGYFRELEAASRSAGLSADEKSAFAERLERRVILVPEQIRSGAWRYEVMTAKGLDYRGKIRLAEAALAGRDERLAVSVASGTEIETIMILPRRMEKDGDDHILVGTSLPEEEPVRFLVRKIGFLKRIKMSLF